MSKVLIYSAANLANTGRMVGVNLGLHEAKKALLKGDISSPIVVYTKQDELKTTTGNISNEIHVKTDNGDTITFIDAKVDVKKEMEIKEERLINRKGSVKELIQEKDYTVKISGTLSTEDVNKFPYEELKLLNTILSSAKSLSVAGAYLDIFDITKLVLKSADFNQSNWKYFNNFPFSLNLVSDDDYDFLIE